jgi:hypothetical protein
VFELVVRYEQRKIDSSSTTKLAKGATGFNVATAPALNNRLELLADNIDAAKFTERSHIFI